MAERDETEAAGKRSKGGRSKAERRQAGGLSKAERRQRQPKGQGSASSDDQPATEAAQAGGQSKGKRRRAARGGGQAARAGAEAKPGRKGQGARKGQAGTPSEVAEDGSREERIESRLSRLEEAVSAQAERSGELLKRLDAMLADAQGSARETDGPQSSEDEEEREAS